MSASAGFRCPVLEGSMAMDVLMPRLRDSTPAPGPRLYGRCLPRFPGALPRRVRRLPAQCAEAGGTLYYHCTAGKDRHRLCVAAAAVRAGVARDDIVANYLESNHWNRRFNEAILARTEALGVPPDVIMPLLEVRPEYLEASIAAIEQAHGGLEAYLADGLGVDIDRLRGHYLKPEPGRSHHYSPPRSRRMRAVDSAIMPSSSVGRPSTGTRLSSRLTRWVLAALACSSRRMPNSPSR